ncbi:hypothetical protein Ancab_008243 [Ancistrocladus abbreviatus]
MDRDRVPMQYDTGNSTYSTRNKGSGGLSLVPCSLFITKGLGQSHRTKEARQNSGKSLMVEPLVGRYVSSPRKTSAGAFMEEETDLIKRREEELFLEPSPVVQSLDSRKTIGSVSKGARAYGPTLPWSSNELDGSGPLLSEERTTYPKRWIAHWAVQETTDQ